MSFVLSFYVLLRVVQPGYNETLQETHQQTTDIPVRNSFADDIKQWLTCGLNVSYTQHMILVFWDLSFLWRVIEPLLRLSPDFPPETPSTSRAAAGRPEASQTGRAQDGSQGEAPAEANSSTASTGTAPLSATQPHWGFNATLLTHFVLSWCDFVTKYF